VKRAGTAKPQILTATRAAVACGARTSNRNRARAVRVKPAAHTVVMTALTR
jgi:hypothetical protein